MEPPLSGGLPLLAVHVGVVAERLVLFCSRSVGFGDAQRFFRARYLYSRCMLM